MTEIDRSSVSIRFIGENLDPDELTRALGYPPAESIRPKFHTITRGSKSQPPKGIWSVSYGESDGTDLEVKIEFLLGKLTSDLTVWNDITSKCDGDVFCGLFLDGWNRGFELSPDLLIKLANRNLRIGFDIYAPVDSWDESPRINPESE